MKIVVVTQARTGSTRFPNKVLKEIQGRSLLQIHIDRIKRSKLIDDIYIATTIKPGDNAIESLAETLNVKCYRGSENDVLDRFYKTVMDVTPDFVIRLTSDCPLIDGNLIDEVVRVAIERKLDYYTNSMEERYPDGQDIEVFTFKALEEAWQHAKLASDREHVTPFIRNNSTYKNGTLFLSDNHGLEENFNHVRLTVDEKEDFEVIKKVVDELGFDQDWKTYAKYYLERRDIYSLNSKIVRNEGYQNSIKENKNN